jgi:hypothetical protein
MFAFNGAQVATQLTNGVPNQAAAEGQMQCRNMGYFKSQAELGAPYYLRVKGLGLRIPIVFFGLRQIGGLREGSFEVRVIAGGKHGQGFEAQPVAVESGDAFGSGPSPDFVTAASQKRTDQPSGRNRAHASQAGEACAAEQAKEHGFGLIGARVAEGDPMQGMFLRGALKESTPNVARFLLGVGYGSVRLFDGDGQAEILGKRADECFIGSGFRAAQVMVDVQDQEFAGEPASQAVENVEQGHGIGPARDSYADALGGRQHLVTRDVFGDSLKQSVRQ